MGLENINTIVITNLTAGSSFDNFENMAHVFINLESTCEILLLTMMILLKGTRFAYTPESMSFTKRGGFVYFVFFVFCFQSNTNSQIQLLSNQGALFFALVLYNEIIAQRLITTSSSWLVRIRNLIFIFDHNSLLIDSEIFRE